MKPDPNGEIGTESRAQGDGSDKDVAWPMTGPSTEIDQSPHTVQFYNADTSLVEEVSAYIATALAGGNAALVVATSAHRHAIANELEARGLSLPRITRQGRYVELDAAETLRKVLVKHAGAWSASRRSGAL